MPLRLGSTTISTLRLGTATPSKVMLGTSLVWPATAVLWTPADLPGITAWYDAEVGVVVNGSLISQWGSSGSSPVAVTQNDAGKQPTLTTVNGKKWVGCLREIDSLRKDAPAAFPFTTVLTVADLLTNAASDRYSHFLSIRQPLAAGSNTYFGFFYAQPGGTEIVLNVTEISNTLASVSINGTSVTGVDLIDIADYLKGYPIGLGVSIMCTTLGVQAAAPVATRVNVACDVETGISGEPNRGLTQARLAQAIFMANAITVSDEEKFEGWAAHTYGATSLLPANHPYKSAPPYK
jgi:hypothetical protein